MLKIDLLPLEFNEIKQSLIERFQGDPKSPFKDYNFEGAGLNYLMEMFAYISSYNNFYLATTINELFLPSAENPKSIFNIAKTLGYRPSRKTAATIMVHPEMNDVPDNFDTKYYETNLFTIPAYRVFISEQGYKFANTEDIYFIYHQGKWKLIKDGIIETDETPIYIQLKQGEWQTMTFYPIDGQPNQTFFIPDENIDNNDSAIVLQEVATKDYWTLFDNLDALDMDLTKNTNDFDKYFLSLTKTKIFMINNESDGVRITFGDDYIGKIPDEFINVFYFITDGSEGNDQRVFVGKNNVPYRMRGGGEGSFSLSQLNMEVDDLVVSVGGSEGEDLDRIKRMAPSMWTTQDRLVIDKDYETFLKHQHRIPLFDVKCIGGENLTPPKMGSIVVVATKHQEFTDFRTSDLILTRDEKQILINLIKSKNITGVTVLFDDPDFVRINVSGNVFYNQLLYDQSTIVAEWQDLILTFFGELTGFNQFFKSSNLIQELDNSDKIKHNNLIFDMDYHKVITKEHLLKISNIDLGNSIQPGSIDKVFGKTEFLRTFNPHTFYPRKTKGKYTFMNNQGEEYSEELNSNEKTTKVHKMFKYDLFDVPNDDNITGNIYLKEYFAQSFASKALDETETPEIEFIPIWVETGKKKIFGKINYLTGLIELFIQNVKWKYSDTNVVNFNLMNETVLQDEVYVEIDNVGFSNFEDLFMYDFYFDDETKLPVRKEGTEFFPVNRGEVYFKINETDGEWIDGNDKMNNKFVLEFNFKTKTNDFRSKGNTIVLMGRRSIVPKTKGK